MRKWLAVHWVYCVASLCAIVVVLLVFLGRLTPDAATGLSLVCVTMFAADFRPQLERHQKEVVQVLSAIAKAGEAAAARNIPGALQAGTQAVEDGTKLAQECEQENKH
jgi:hypothetical protein